MKTPSNIRFTKIKYGGDPTKTILVYEKENSDGGWDKFTIESREAPHGDFFTALSRLDLHLWEMCEQPEGAVCEAKSISISWANDIMGAVISGQRTLFNSHQPLNLNTPHKSAESYSDYEDEKQLLSDDAIIDIRSLMDEAWMFVDGKRAQGSLFEPKPEMEAAES